MKLRESHLQFPPQNVIRWNWQGTDIKKESQGQNKSSNTIQYKVIQTLKTGTDYYILFDDDDSGEIADVVAIKEDEANKSFVFELYHCKFSTEAYPGARVADLYAVCGQSEKCVKWVQNTQGLIARLRNRENDRTNSGQVSRFEEGNMQLLHILGKKLKFYSVKYQVFIVQPGVDGANISESMHQVLCSASSYLMDTYGIPLILICS